MAMYICENCGTYENTALGNWWFRDRNKKLGANPATGKPFPNDMPLCCACTPALNDEGKPVGLKRNGELKFGRWHNVFERKMWDGKMPIENTMDYQSYLDKYSAIFEKSLSDQESVPRKLKSLVGDI